MKQKIVLSGLILSVMAVLGYFAYQSANDPNSGKLEYQTVYWNKLKELNVKTGQKTDSLADLDGKRIRVPGFIVPLDDDAKGGLSEFLLVPSQTACIHVPPPPANQMIYVQMKSNETPKRENGPIWLSGILRITTVKSGFGQVAFKMLGEKSEVFTY